MGSKEAVHKPQPLSAQALGPRICEHSFQNLLYAEGIVETDVVLARVRVRQRPTSS